MYTWGDNVLDSAVSVGIRRKRVQNELFVFIDVNKPFISYASMIDLMLLFVIVVVFVFFFYLERRYQF